jgi:hypothetical protein
MCHLAFSIRDFTERVLLCGYQVRNEGVWQPDVGIKWPMKNVK